MYRIINYCFGFILIYLFILEGNATDHIRILSGVALAVIISGIVFVLNQISLDSIKSTILVGVFSLGLGGIPLALAVVTFFVSSSSLSGLSDEKKNYSLNQNLSGETRRTGYQILANGFWLMFFLIFWFSTGIQSFLIAAFASIAAANSDTWATEIGQYKPGKTINVLTFKNAQPGTDGGVSLKGSIAAFAGAILISLFVFIKPMQAPIGMMVIIVFTGLAGAFADSAFGAYLLEKENRFKPPSDFSGSTSQFLNNITNWSATGVAGILALIITQIVIG